MKNINLRIGLNYVLLRQNIIMNIIDTHTHLFVKEFDEDRNEVIERALASGIKKMIFPCITTSDIPILLELATKYPESCFPAVGLHPSDVKDDFNTEIEIIEENLKTGKFIAVGETGIDLYWDKTFIDIQKKSFEKQVLLAKKYNLPIIIHVREAFNEVFEIIDKHNDENLKGVFHSFTGDLEQAKKICGYGNFMIGINGIVTFKNSGLGKVVEEISINKLILETDSPYLSPAPKRGRRNESSHLVHIAQKIADIKNISIEELQDNTNKNSIKLFGNKLA